MNMKTEFEIVFDAVNHEIIREQIKKLWWICTQKKTLMKRAIFTNPLIPKGAFLRVRDEGNKITCTYKEILDWVNDINAVKEIETELDNMQNMISIFKSVWLKQKAYQESWRETWKINNEIEIMLDQWPWIKPFIEIEGESEELVRKYVKKFWFKYKQWLFGCVDQVYLKEIWLEPDVLNNLAEITFDKIPKT